MYGYLISQCRFTVIFFYIASLKNDATYNTVLIKIRVAWCQKYNRKKKYLGLYCFWLPCLEPWVIRSNWLLDFLTLWYLNLIWKIIYIYVKVRSFYTQSETLCFFIRCHRSIQNTMTSFAWYFMVLKPLPNCRHLDWI